MILVIHAYGKVILFYLEIIQKKIIINKIDFKSFIIYEIDVLTAFWLLPNSLNFYSSPYAFSGPSIISPML